MISTSLFQPWFTAPSLSLLATEPLRAMFDMFGSSLGSSAERVGDGHPVVVFPGLGGAAYSTSQLRRFLDESGFKAHDWSGGVNTGPVGEWEQWLGGLEQQVRGLHADGGRKVSLIGWSLGGVYAREIAKLCPGAVRQVITLAAPFGLMGAATLGGVVLPPRLPARLRDGPPVPTTSIYSRSDGVVSWRGCIGRRGAYAENVEVGASHLGMGSHPEVLRIIANRLAQPDGQWRPLRRRQRPEPAASGMA